MEKSLSLWRRGIARIDTSARAGAQEWENEVVSKLRKLLLAGCLTFVSDCAPAVIAITVYRKENVDPGIKRRLVVRQPVFV